jgi:hypothetical protein
MIGLGTASPISNSVGMTNSAAIEITQWGTEYTAGTWVETTTTIAGLVLTERTYLTGHGTTPEKARKELAAIVAEATR